MGGVWEGGKGWGSWEGLWSKDGTVEDLGEARKGRSLVHKCTSYSIVKLLWIYRMSHRGDT